MGPPRPRLSLFGQHARQDLQRDLRQPPCQSTSSLFSSQSFSRIPLAVHLLKITDQISLLVLSQTSLLRALDPSTTKTYLFPAMNTLMYTHPLTAKQLRIVKDEIGYEVHGPQAGKALACGDIGQLRYDQEFWL
jgi:hypothetical protein